MAVHLTRIYTRTGDDGSTGLGDGSRVYKDHLRVEAYGTVDELNSTLGLCVLHSAKGPLTPILQAIQNDLFDVGADLCVPGEAGARLRIPAGYVERLEKWIDEHNARLQPLNSFILPGGEPLAAWLHLARTVARRAERCVTELLHDPAEAGRVNLEVVRYLNRLSDLLFVLARIANQEGRADVLWVPGKNR